MKDIQNMNDVLDGFKIKAKCTDVSRNRHFIHYDIALNHGTKINKISQYATELAIALCLKTPFTVIPMPDKGIVRLHATYTASDAILLRDIYDANDRDKTHFVSFLLGESAEGKKVWVDMSKNPHLLVAGSTGSGKSVFLHTLIHNALQQPDVNLFLIDTKRVEFNIYNDFRFQNRVWEVSDNYDDAMNTLYRLYNIMEHRYKYMADMGVQNIEHAPHLFNKIMVIIDEVADLILYNRSKEAETLIVKLAQKARAAGIYLVLATQRPSVDVITGLIKSNFPARLACKVSTKTDSRVILDQQGAENLAGRGDAILKIPGLNKEVRLQTPFIHPMDNVLLMEED